MGGRVRGEWRRRRRMRKKWRLEEKERERERVVNGRAVVIDERHCERKKSRKRASSRNKNALGIPRT